jgi:CHAT domain-containing protein
MGEAPETRARLMVEEAALALHDGDRPGAARHLERAVRTLESMRRTAAAGLATDFYSADMAESLETLVGLYGALGDAPNLQRIGELLKGVALAEQLEQDVLVRPESSGRLPSDRPARFEGSHHPLPGPLGLAALQAAVPAHAAMLDYYILPDGGFVLWVTRETARLFPLATPRVELVRAIDETMARLRTHRNTDADLTGLSKRLLEPVAGVLAAAAPDLLLIAPHGVLHMFPFEALPFGPGRLIDATAVAYLPTPGALRWQRGASSRHPAGKVLVLGDPTSDLPEARGEAQDVGKYLGVEPLVGAAADRGAVAGAGALSVLHIASHGHQSWTRDGAWLALADGRFGPREIRMLSLPGALVVLSACESGIAPVSAGDEMPEALDRSFLAAGAETVVSTRWQVSDRVTRDLMSRFYARIGAADHPQPAQAWAEAVRTHRAQIGTLAQNALGATRGISPASSPLGASPDRLEHWAAFKVVVAPRSSAFP